MGDARGVLDAIPPNPELVNNDIAVTLSVFHPDPAWPGLSVTG
jgi:hypothetical protein